MRNTKINLSDHMPAGDILKQRDEKLKKACKEFESIFTYELLKSMRRTIEKNDLFHGGKGEEIYESLLDQELAKKVAGHDSRGLAAMLYQQLKRHDIPATGNGEVIDRPEFIDNNLPRRPLKAKLSSKFGWRKDPLTGKNRFHSGIDLATREGTFVQASLPGKVLFSDYQQGYGNMVVMDHGHGFSTLYAHNKENLVKQGDWVKKGSPIATVGSTGRSTGTHLHFEIRRHGRRLDPADFFGS